MIAAQMKELVGEKQVAYGHTVMEMEVMPDHVHLRLNIDPLVAKIKGYPFHEMCQEFSWRKKRFRTFWTSIQFIATVGAVTLEVVKQSIVSQKGA